MPDSPAKPFLLKAADIDAMEGLRKTHFVNPNAVRINKSLGDLTGLTAIGVHMVEIAPGRDSSEHHLHYHEEECVYVLSGTATAYQGDDAHPIGPGDFLSYPPGGPAHSITNTGDGPLTLLVIGQRLPHDVGEYPRAGKRIYRNAGLDWNLVDLDAIHSVAPRPKA